MFEKYWKVDGFVSVPNSKQNFYINVEGKMLSPIGNQVEYSTDDDGHAQVFADLWDGLRHYRVIDLVAIVFKRISIPCELWNEVSGFPIDGDKTNLHASNVGYRFRNGPLACPRYPSFYYIPMFTKYAIDEEGYLIRIHPFCYRQFSITPGNAKRNITGGYYLCQAPMDIGKLGTLSRHRAMVLSLRPYPDNVDKLDVNHIDGVPGNDTLDNLELVTRSRNNTHAVEIGLKTDNKPVLVRDVRTGEVKRFFSVAECARALGHNSDATVSFRLCHGKYGTVYSDGFQFKYEDDARDWPEVGDAEGAIKEASISKPVLLRLVRTGKVTRYDSVTKAAVVVGVGRETLKYRLNNDLRVPYMGFQFKYEDDPRDWLECSEEDYVTEVVSAAQKVLVVSGLGETMYDSVKSAYDKTKLANLRYYLAEGKQPHYASGFKVKLLEDEWDSERAVFVYSGALRARHIGTGKIVEAGSAQELGKILGLDAKKLSEASKTHGARVWGTYQVRPIEDVGEWTTLPEDEIKAILNGLPKSGYMKKIMDIETGEARYYNKAEDVLGKVEGVNSLPVLFRVIKKKKLLGGRFKIESYRPSCLLNP